MLVTRIAPTPSGFLHPGNAVNFVLTSWLAKQHRGRLLLRIDDMDAARVRPEYVDDVFRVIEWLGLDVDAGPSDAEQFRRDFSMGHRTDYYRLAVGELASAGAAVFACRCSRRDLAGHAAGRYPGSCRDADLAWIGGETALRVAVPAPCPISVAGREVDLAAAMGDFVVWRRDDLPAYQLASVIEDRDLGVNAVVRGLDLLPSTAAQLFLAPMLGAGTLASADFRHHGLIDGAPGVKLSKSTGARGRSMAGDGALLERILGWARAMAGSVGIEAQA